MCTAPSHAWTALSTQPPGAGFQDDDRYAAEDAAELLQVAEADGAPVAFLAALREGVADYPSEE